MQQLILYSTANCTLCDEALDLLFQIPGLAGLQLDVIDVVNNDALLERYGERIPVLRIAERELAAPFTAAEVATFLAAK